MGQEGGRLRGSREGLSAAQLSLADLGSAQISLAQLSSARHCSGWLSAAGHSSAQLGSGRLGSAHFSSAQLSTAPAARREVSYEALGKSESDAIPGTARADPQPPPELPGTPRGSRPGGLSPARGSDQRGCRGRSGAEPNGAEPGGPSPGWGRCRQRHPPGSTPPKSGRGFAVTPALGWQRDSRTAAGQWDGSQPRWRLERSGGGRLQPVCLLVALLLLGDILLLLLF